jgi:DNA-binding beta-propeller fold protein YncE
VANCQYERQEMTVSDSPLRRRATMSRIIRCGARGITAAGLAGVLIGSLAVYATEAGGATSGLPTAYVTNSQLTSLSVYSGATFAGTIANVGRGPTGIAVDPSTEEAYVADYGYLNEPAHTVTPVDLRTGAPGHPISVGSGPLAIALTPEGRDAVVTLQGTASSPGHQIREVDLASGAVSAPVGVGTNPESLAITPDGTVAYVAGFSSDEITPVNLTTWPPVAEAPIVLPSGTFPRAIAIAPDGKRAYVLDAEHATVIPINLATDHVGTPVSLVCQAEGDPGCTPDAITISPSGRTAYVAAAGSSDLLLLSLPSLSVAAVAQTGGYPDGLGLSGRWLYVANAASNTVSVFTGLRSPRNLGNVTYPFGVAVLPGTDKSTSGADGPALAPVGGGDSHLAPRVLDGEAPFYGFPTPGN